jgi:biopolymer transport protein ExbD
MKLQRKTFSADVPTMAMGDIAFLLLIFFVVLARADDDSHLKWEPANVDNIIHLEMTDVSIVVDHEQKLYLNGKRVSHGELAGAIKGRLEGRSMGDRKVRLKCDQHAQASIFEPVIEAISEAGGELEYVLEQRDIN